VNKEKKDCQDYQANLELKDLLVPEVFREKRVTVV